LQDKRKKRQLEKANRKKYLLDQSGDELGIFSICGTFNLFDESHLEFVVEPFFGFAIEGSLRELFQ
jgi:hypothetical protein